MTSFEGWPRDGWRWYGCPRDGWPRDGWPWDGWPLDGGKPRRMPLDGWRRDGCPRDGGRPRWMSPTLKVCFSNVLEGLSGCDCLISFGWYVWVQRCVSLVDASSGVCVGGWVVGWVCIGACAGAGGWRSTCSGGIYFGLLNCSHSGDKVMN